MTPAYIRAIRERFGQGRLLLPGVSAVVVREEDGIRQVLLNRRSDSGAWAVPSGIVEPGEQPAVAALRELSEETAIRARVQRLALLTADPELVYANGDHAQYIAMTFRCEYEEGDAHVADDESLEVRWFALDRLPELDPIQRRRLDVALEDRPDCVFDL